MAHINFLIRHTQRAALWVTVVYGGVWWCMVVYGGLQWCMAVNGGVWRCMVVYGGVWWCMVFYLLPKHHLLHCSPSTAQDPRVLDVQFRL